MKNNKKKNIIVEMNIYLLNPNLLVQNFKYFIQPFDDRSSLFFSKIALFLKTLVNKHLNLNNIFSNNIKFLKEIDYNFGRIKDNGIYNYDLVYVITNYKKEEGLNNYNFKNMTKRIVFEFDI